MVNSYCHNTFQNDNATWGHVKTITREHSLNVYTRISYLPEADDSRDPVKTVYGYCLPNGTKLLYLNTTECSHPLGRNKTWVERCGDWEAVTGRVSQIMGRVVQNTESRIDEPYIPRNSRPLTMFNNLVRFTITLIIWKRVSFINHLVWSWTAELIHVSWDRCIPELIVGDISFKMRIIFYSLK